MDGNKNSIGVAGWIFLIVIILLALPMIAASAINNTSEINTIDNQTLIILQGVGYATGMIITSMAIINIVLTIIVISVIIIRTRR